MQILQTILDYLRKGRTRTTVSNETIESFEKLFIASGEEVTYRNLTVKGYLGIAGVCRVLEKLEVDGGTIEFEEGGVLIRRVD